MTVSHQEARVQEQKRREATTQKLLPNLSEVINLQVETAQRAPSKRNTKKIKLKQNNQVAAHQLERQTWQSGKKTHDIQKMKTRTTAQFSSGTMAHREQWDNTLKALKGKNGQARILLTTRASFKNRDKDLFQINKS